MGDEGAYHGVSIGPGVRTCQTSRRSPTFPHFLYSDPPVVAALATGELPVLVVNPRQLRDLAGATGNLARADALVGVASFHRDSGNLRRKRTVRGGCARVRAALYMGALAASRFNPVMGASMNCC